MSINNTVLIIGGTSGIGAGLARAIHGQGKKVIVTGRRQDRLKALAAELPGLETSAFDFSYIPTLPAKVHELFKSHPEIDTVIVNAGIQNFLLFNDGKTPQPDRIAQEVTTNVTAPMILCQTLVPIFLKKNKPCSIILLSSGLAFVPVPFFSVYTATKAAVHTFTVALRAQLSGTSINITELIPPYVETELDAAHKAEMDAMLGGPENAPKPMPLKEFIKKSMLQLDSMIDGKPLREVPIGELPSTALAASRAAMDPILKGFHIDA